MQELVLEGEFSFAIFLMFAYACTISIFSNPRGILAPLT